MTTSVIPLVRKEVRGLLAMWLVCLVTIALTATIGRGLESIGFGVYAFGAVAIGALSIGQEYNNRTLTLLLSQPVNRGRLLLHKNAVLAVMLAVLAAAVWGTVAEIATVVDNPASPRAWPAVMLFVPLLSGFFLAPCLTMVCGSPLAGAVFAVAIPGAMWVGGDLTSAIVYGGELSQTAAAKALSQDIFWRGTVLLSLAAGVGSWRSFTRLEAIERRGFDVRLPAWLRFRSREADVAGVARRNSWWLLAAKEMHLQQLTFAISALYAASWVVLLLLTPISVQTRVTILYIATLLHSGAVPLLAGSIASAEERQLGVLSWHTLLPIAAWKQWAIKSSVVIGLTLTLVLGLPTALSFLPGSHALTVGELSSPITWSYVFALMAVAVGALYVSSLCASGVRALMISMPVGLVVLHILGDHNYYRMLVEQLRYFWSRPELVTRALLYELLAQAVWVVGAIAVVALLLRFGLANHRSAERGRRRVAKQVGVIAGVILVVVLAGTGVSAYARAEYRRLQRSETRVRVSGVVVDGQGRPVTKYTVAVFGKRSGTFWTNAFSRGAFIRPDRSGEFTIPQVPVGQYDVVAVSELTDKARTDVDSLDRLRALTIPVELAADRPNRLTLTLTEF